MKTFLSIEVNEQKLRYLLVQQGSKGVSVKGSGVSMVQVGPSAPGALASFIKKLAASEQVKVDRLFLTINRRDTVVHQFNLGQVSKADLGQIIPAEIEKIHSFADRDFDYVHHRYDVKTRSTVIFGAMTDNLLQYLIKEIEETGIPCHDIEMAPLNLSGLLGGAEHKDGPECLIVLSNNITHLVVFEDRQIRLLYSSTMEEEILDDPSASVTWGEELKRVLKSYVLETKKTVDQVWLVWDRDKSPHFDNYLRQELNINAKPLDLFHEWSGDNINPVYVLAAVPLMYHLRKIKPVFSLNHFLRDLQVSVRMRYAAIAATVFVLLTGLVLGGMAGHFIHIKAQALAQTRDLQQQLVALQKQSADILNERNVYQATRQQLLFQATYVQILKDMSWSEALNVVASELPRELSLLSFKVDEMGVVTITGEAFRMESIAKLLRTIEKSSILDRGQFSSLTEAQVENKKVFQFGILANIRTTRERT